MILAFTGTRRGMTPRQLVALPSVLAALPTRALHGGAVGADERFDMFLRAHGMPAAQIEVYALPDREHKWLGAVYWLGPRSTPGQIVHLRDDPLARDREMVARCDALLAAPATAAEQLRSGTWAIVSYARAAGRLVTLLLPDGFVREERAP